MSASDRMHPLDPLGHPARGHVQARPDGRSVAGRIGHALLAPLRGIARRRWLLWTIVTLAVVLIAARIAAPYAVRWYANRVINGTPSYQGGVGDVTLHLWRGAYSVDNIVVSQIGAGDLDPLFTCARLEFSVAWPQLVHGAVVARATFRDP